LFTFRQNLIGESRYVLETRERQAWFFMEERYKGHVIRVTTEKDNSAFPWKPICTILDGASREVIKQIDWQLGYETSDQAEKVGLLISKKWIDAGKP
jgi:hypothetical protein